MLNNLFLLSRCTKAINNSDSFLFDGPTHDFTINKIGKSLFHVDVYDGSHIVNCFTTNNLWSLNNIHSV